MFRARFSFLTATGLVIFGFLFIYAAVNSQSSQVQVPKELRAQRDTWTPLMEVLAPKRTRVTDEQLEKMRKLPIEAMWGVVRNKGYNNCFVNHLKLTQPGTKMAGRALTMRYMPLRPDLDEGVKQLAKEGNWDHQFNVRAGEDTKPGDVVVVELGGAVDRATFIGDMTALGIKLRGAKGIVVDGGVRDLTEYFPWKDFPIYYAGAHASAMADHIGVEWNAPIRIGMVTVLPGDVVVGDDEGILFFPPQLAEEVIAGAENTVYVEDFKREMMLSGKYRTRDIYPRLSPEVEKVFVEWKKKHPRKP